MLLWTNILLVGAGTLQLYKKMLERKIILTYITTVLYSGISFSDKQGNCVTWLDKPTGKISIIEDIKSKIGDI